MISLFLPEVHEEVSASERARRRKECAHHGAYWQ